MEASYAFMTKPSSLLGVHLSWFQSNRLNGADLIVMTSRAHLFRKLSFGSQFPLLEECFLRVLVEVVFEVQLLEIWKSMYPTLNLIDSSALPWSRIELRALGKISEGEELTVSYIDFLNISEERKKQLKRQYYFDCTCEHCQKGLKDDLFLGVKDNPKVHAAHHWSALGRLPQELDQGGLPSYPQCPCLLDCGQCTTDGS